MRTEKEAIAYLEEIAKSGSILGLETMRGLMGELSNVQERLKIVHVAGTNGKGSVSMMIASVLQKAGYCVGVFTSPAVFDRKEQYQVNGQSITPEDFTEVISEVKEACLRYVAKGGAQPTVFEAETAAAFLYFCRRNCQAAVLETGMGGATDATNIIRRPLVSVITSVSMDHMKFLGNSLEEIAAVKAGIVKEGCPAVAVRPKQKSVQELIEEACADSHAALTYSEAERACDIRRFWEGNEMRQSFLYPAGDWGGDLLLAQKEGRPQEFFKVTLSMMGDWQIENAACAIEAVKSLQKRGFAISREALLEGLLQARWEGRFSVLCRKPFTVMDGAHNADAAKKLRKTLERGFTNQRIIYIIGVLADKEHEEMLQIMLPLASRVYTVTPDHCRAMDGRRLAAEAGRYHGHVLYCPTVKEAVEQSFSAAGQEGMILAFGSLSYLRELREAVRDRI